MRILAQDFFISLKESDGTMKKNFFRLLSKMNKAVLPNYSRKQLDLQKAGKFQKAVIGWKLWVTKNALND